MKNKCILSLRFTLAAAALWLIAPACILLWCISILGPDPRLLYLAGVTLFPASLTLLAPWLRAYLRYKEERNE